MNQWIIENAEWAFILLLIILATGVFFIRMASAIYWGDRCHRCKAKGSGKWSINQDHEEEYLCSECGYELYYQLPERVFG